MTPGKRVQDQAAASLSTYSNIYSQLVKTPLLRSRKSPPPASVNSRHTGLWFKCENLQHTGSFKLRGALAKLSTVDTDSDVVTASSGNHGIACAYAARDTGHKLTVVLPEQVVVEKHKQITDLGARTILIPGDAERAEQHAQELAKERDMAYVSPYNDHTVIAGQGTIALELLEQLPHIDNVFISMGGGGLISGIGSVIKAHSPKTKIIGVSATHSAALAESLDAGHIVVTEHKNTLADGCAGAIHPEAITLPLAMAVIDTVVQCSEAQIEHAIRDLAWNEKMLVEGSAALALAAFNADPSAYAGKTNVVVLCGANFNRELILGIISKTELID